MTSNETQPMYAGADDAGVAAVLASDLTVRSTVESDGADRGTV
jgi:hypothetical protein